jgi:hypothetical protein
MNAIIISYPSNYDWEDYKEELKAAERGDILNFKVSNFPTKVKEGDRCYIVHKGFIKGWMTICGFSTKEFTCTTTGRKFKGNFIERSGKFHYLEEKIPYKGFQGFRYFDPDDINNNK